ncbi:MAG: amidohydrolase family protein [Solirubrobacterales bacterium]
MVVDVHGHVTHPDLAKAFPMPASLTDIDGMLEQKAAAGIDLTIVGSPVGFGTMVPMPGHDNYAQPLDRMQSFHVWLAETVDAHGEHMRAYAYTNPMGDDDLLAQTAETVRDGGFVGLMVNTSVRGDYLDSERAGPFFEMAAELGVPVFLHPPAAPIGTEAMGDLRLVTHVARFNDVTSCVALLAFRGVLARYPTVEFIAPMAGGAMSLLAERLDLAATERVPGPPGSTPEAPPGGPPSEQLARVHVDTGTSSASALAADLAMVGVQRMLFGTDSPPATVPVEKGLGLVRDMDIAEDDKDAILGENARKLFGL